MSEPTYRVELTHRPENGVDLEWEAAVYSIIDGDDPFTNPMFSCYRATREDAFTVAQAWTKAKAQEPQHPSTVLLTEDGDILDPHEVQR